MLTAYPPPGSGVAETSSDPLTVPSGGLSGQTLTVAAGIPPLPSDTQLNGTTSPTALNSEPSTVTVSGCTDGFGTVSVIGQDPSTGVYSGSTYTLAESPVGSGQYSATIPPVAPIHGPAEVDSSVACVPQGPLMPDGGPSTGGTDVVISGSGFTGATAVSFGGTPAQSFTVDTDQEIDAVAPAGSGTVPVKVTVGGVTQTAADYTYSAITSVSPAQGPAAGGTTVVIKGTGLGQATQVLFGTTGAQFTQVSDTEIDAVSPPGTGTQAITVQTLFGGTTPVTSADRFSYSAAAASSAATATAASPLSGPEEARLGARLLAAVKARAAGDSASTAAVGAGSGPSERNDSLLPGSFSMQDAIEWGVDHIPTYGNYIASIINSAKAYLHPTCATTEAEQIAILMAGLTPYLLKIGQVVGLGLTLLLIDESAGIGAFFEAAIEKVLTVAATAFMMYLAKGIVTMLIRALMYFKCGWHPSNDALFDPSGAVLDTNGHPVSGATVTISRSATKNGAYLPVSASSPGISPAVNPETTGANGTFDWDVSAGYYKITATKTGCTTATIGPYPVPPPRVGLTITMTCANEAKAVAPAVSSVSAAAGPVAGGTVLTVLGGDFTPASKVTFGGVAAKSVTYYSPEALSVTTPKAAAGLVDVQVTTAGGTSAKSGADKFYFGAAPTITKVSTASGAAAGGTTVTLTGTNFTGATQVSFGDVAAAKFTVKSATEIVAVTAKGPAGPAIIQVTNPAGYGSAAGFGFLAPETSYVATSGGVVPVPVATGKAGPVIKVSGATALASTRYGDTVLVAGGAGVRPVSTTSGQAGAVIKTGTTPKAVAITPNGATAYVVNSGSGTVTPVSLTTLATRSPIRVGSKPVAIVITPNGKTAYVANYGSGTVTPITVATGRAGAAIRVGSDPDALAVTPNGKTVYVANYGSGTVTPITVATGRAGTAIRVGSRPDALAVTPNGATLYVANGGSATVTPVAVSTGRAARAIATARTPVALAVTPDGRTLYVVSAAAGTLTPFASATGKAGRPVAVGTGAAALVLTP